MADWVAGDMRNDSAHIRKGVWKISIIQSPRKLNRFFTRLSKRPTAGKLGWTNSHPQTLLAINHSVNSDNVQCDATFWPIKGVVGKVFHAHAYPSVRL